MTVPLAWINQGFQATSASQGKKRPILTFALLNERSVLASSFAARKGQVWSRSSHRIWTSWICQHNYIYTSWARATDWKTIRTLGKEGHPRLLFWGFFWGGGTLVTLFCLHLHSGLEKLKISPLVFFLSSAFSLGYFFLLICYLRTGPVLIDWRTHSLKIKMKVQQMNK